MTKAELGIKRLCANCAAKYYDLNKDPIICPRCGTQFEAPPAAKPRTQAAAAAQTAAPVVEATETEEAPAAELVSLEEADEESADSGAVKIEVDDDSEIETNDEEEDDTFLADDEDEANDDVSDIIGDVDEEET